MKPARKKATSILKSMSKEELVELLTVLAKHDPAVERFIEKKGTTGAGVDDLLAEKYLDKIQVLSEEDVWYDRYTESGNLPDHWSLRTEFADLNTEGHHDVFVTIGPEYLKGANILVEQVTQEEHCDYGMNECLEEIVKGIEQSALPIETRIYTIIMMDIEDTWGMIGNPRLTEHEYPPEVWSRVTDMLLARKGDYPKPPGKRETNFHRWKYAMWVVLCLDRAGRKEEMFSFAESEAEENYMYVDYVKILTREGNLEEAKRWIERGITATQRIYPGIAHELSDMKKQI